MGILDDIANEAIGGGTVIVKLPDPEANRLPASFRGVDFWVPSENDSIGRIQAIHEFPSGDGDERLPFAEDMGAVTPDFTIEAFLIGPDQLADSFYLEEAINKRGPGKLIHPHRGELNVAVNGKVAVRRTTQEGGMVRYTIPFVATGEQPQPVVEFALGDDIGLKSDTVNALIVGGADGLLDTSGPSFLGTEVVDAINDAVGKLQAVNATVSAQLGVIESASAGITAFAANVTTLIGTPAALALQMQGLVNSVFNAISAIATSLEQYSRGDEVTNRARVGLALAQINTLGAFGDDYPDVTGTTASELKQAQNQAFTTDLMEVTAVSEGARAMARLPFESVSQAEDAREALDSVFDRVLDRGTVNGDVAGALRDLRVSFYSLMERTTTRLSTVAEYVPKTTMPLVVIAHDVHGDARRAVEIALRNNVEYPSFAPGLQPLEVLT